MIELCATCRRRYKLLLLAEQGNPLLARKAIMERFGVSSATAKRDRAAVKKALRGLH